MKRLAAGLSILLLTAVAVPEERTVGAFRLRDDSQGETLRGWITSFDEEGFAFEPFGGGRRMKFEWSEIRPLDAQRLRVSLGLEMGDEERRRVVRGHEIRFLGGFVRRGLLVRVDPDGVHWLRHDGHLLPYPSERIDEVVETDVPEAEIYTKEELYVRSLERRRPRNALEHKLLGDYLFDTGNFARAKEHYGEAIALDSDYRKRLEPLVEQLEQLVADEETREVLGRAKAKVFVQADFEGARRDIERFIERHPERKRVALALLDRIEERWYERQVRRFDFVKHEEYDRAVDDYLRRLKPETIAEAMRWVRESLPEELRRRVRGRMGLGDEEYARFLETESRITPHHASYWTGSFIVSSRAKRGEASKGKGDPEAWWTRYRDVSVRKSWLKAYGAEKLPEIFELTYVRLTPCPRCGGDGQVDKASFTSVGRAGKHTWREWCPRCFGACEERGVDYR